MRVFIQVSFVLVGILNLLPVSGVLSDARLAALYGVGGLENDVSLLLRHRALLFGIVGGLLVYAAFRPDLRGVAALAGILSMASFSVLAFSLPHSSSNLTRIAWIDVAASVLLIAAYAAHAVLLRGASNTPHA